jgi:O-antigen ligase
LTLSNKLSALVASRWFALADLACAALGGLWWYSQPGIGAWPLLIALAPWALRLGAGHFPVRRTIFDPLVIIFLLTAAVGVWAAYDRDAAWAKLWVLVGAALLFYALAAQPEENIWLVAALLGLVGAGLAAYFLLTYDWLNLPRHFAGIDRIGVWWMSVRPSFSGFLHPNVAGGLLAMLIPFQIAGWLRGLRERRPLWVLFNSLLGALTLFAFVLTSSRGAWGALVIALALGGLWLVGRRLARRWRQPGWVVGLPLVVLAVSLGLLAIWSYPGGLSALASRVTDGATRYDLANNTLRLAADFPFTGGGLGAFSGLYSRYMLVIVVPDYTYSHNFYLDVLLEQGVFGLLALLGILIGSLGLLARRRSPEGVDSDGLLRWALATGLLAVCLHGLLDDALYGNQGTPLLLVLSGLTVALAAPSLQPARRADRVVNQTGGGATVDWRRVAGPAAIGGAVVAAMALVLFGSRLAAAWYADLGAVDMARLELAGWPQARPDQPIPASAFGPSQALFARSLQLDPANQTANYRLGLLADRQGDYEQGVASLETAYRADSGHRGVIKELGDDYVWLGQTSRAESLLTQIPEAAEQMDAFTWWWKQQGRPDRAAYAARMATQLRGTASASAP